MDYSAVNTIWVLVGAALVFFMQAGFAMVETGFTRAKNAGNIIMKNLMDFCIGTPVFWLVGFGLIEQNDQRVELPAGSALLLLLTSMASRVSASPSRSAASSLKKTAVLALDLASSTPVVVAPVKSSATAPINGIVYSPFFVPLVIDPFFCA